MDAITSIEHQWISLADGVRLSARIWLPAQAENQSVPAVLEYIPYRKRDMVRLRDERNHPYFAAHGYACVRVDMRGSGDSEGCMEDMYTAHELDDAIDVIEWIASQDWCNGDVGMMGTSWGGTSSLQAASRRPPALKAVIAVCATNNRFDDDIHHMGGCLLTDTVEWGATLPAILASPPDPDSVGSEWRDIWMRRLEKLTFPLQHWVKHETRDDYWRWGSVDENADAIACPVLMIGGWADRYSNTVMNFIEHSHQRCWGIVGAWGHHYPDQANPAPGIGFQQEALRWWDHWLRGVDNRIDTEARLRVWMQDYVTPCDAISTRPGRWIAEANWPSKNIKLNVLHASGAGELVESPAQTGLRVDIPGQLSIGGSAGDTGYFGRAGGLPLDQRPDDEQSLVFETEPLQDAIEILGSVSFNAVLSTDQPVAMLAVRLNDVHPDGHVARVSYAVKNLALDQHNAGIETPCFKQEKTQEKTVVVQLANTAYRFASGHRIRLSLSSSYWPMIWPAPVMARVTLLQDSVTLSLPQRIQTDDATPVELAPVDTCESLNQTAIADQAHQVVSAAKLQRGVAISADQQTRTIHWQQPYCAVYHPSINLEFGFATDAAHKISLSDPTSAVSRFQHHLRFVRDDWLVDVTCSAELSSSKSHFKVHGKMSIVENGETVFTREWNPEIERTCS